MDDPAQDQATQNQQPVVQPTQPPVPMQPQPVPTAITPGISKEHAPIPTGSSISELVQSAESKIELQKEVAEAGVEVISNVPQLSAQDQKAGITLAKESAPVTTQPSGIVQLPIQKHDVLYGIKIHKKITDAVTWWLNSMLRQYKILERKQEEK